MTLAKQGLTLVAVPLACQLVFGGSLAAALLETEKEINKCVGSAALLQTSNSLQKKILELRPAIQSYVESDGQTEEALNQVLSALRKDIRQLNHLSSKDPEGQEVNLMVEALLTSIEKSMAAFKQGYSFAGFGVRGNTIKTIMSTTAYTQKLIERQYEIIVASAKVQEQQKEHLKLLFAWGVLLNVVVALGLAIYFSKGTAARLRILMDNTTRFARGDQLNPPIGGKDEISTLDAFFASMASKVIETRQKEQELQNLKQDFVAMVSHDLRTPLTAVQCTLQLMAEGKYGQQSPESMKWLNTSDNNIRRMIMLINSLLDVEKMECGGLDLVLADSNSQSIIDKAVAVVAGQAQRLGVDIKIEAENLHFLADQERLVQVLVNLLGNALKFSKNGDTIVVIAKQSETYVEFMVKDMGPGISTENQEVVFDRFRQLSSDDAKLRKGSGLGLYICKAIVEQHGGKIGVQSEIQKGSSFWFKIPRQDKPALQKTDSINTQV